jgi:2-polyprenyl-3-methyl-5-hydroxy-6-metoxy-1,4-benzoquinol methylase
MSASKVNEVRAFFEQPDLYLTEKNRDTITRRARIVADMLGPLGPPDGGARVLDLGCGDGSISLQFAADVRELVLVDLSAKMLERARANVPAAARGRVRLERRDIQALEPGPGDEPFDVVLCIGVLAHVPSVDATIAKIASLLRPGGRCVLQITDQGQLLGRAVDLYYRLRRRLANEGTHAVNETTSAQIEALASAHGLGLTELRRHAFLLPGIGRLPRRVREELDRIVAERQQLAPLTVEALLLFRKR